MSECDAKECLGDKIAKWHPVVVFVNENGARVECCVGIKVCDACKAATRLPSDVLGESDIEKIRGSLERSFKTRIPIIRLEWTELGSKLAKQLLEMKRKG